MELTVSIEWQPSVDLEAVDRLAALLLDADLQFQQLDRLERQDAMPPSTETDTERTADV